VEFQIIAIAVFDDGIIRHDEPSVSDFPGKHIYVA